MKQVIIFLSFLIPLISQAQGVNSYIDGHPYWSERSNIYEVNVRQYSREGTFVAFEKQMPRLKKMGVEILWFMPINPISKKDRKGNLGSYYAVADYTAINPEFGTLKDFIHLVNYAHSLGFRVIIDWVPNHSGADNRWLTSHPDFYVKDKNGNPVSPYDWSDTRKLNYKNPEMADSMIRAMKFWITKANVDGFRCDVAGDVPAEFWTNCIKQLRNIKNLFMLAEASAAWLHKTGFDATYSWDEFGMMKLIARGERPAFALDSVLQKIDAAYPENALRMYFTSNHDENSWNKADYGTMPGASHAPFAVLTQTIKRSIPLIYSGQEEPVLDSISFFYKDSIHFQYYKRAPFYKTLLSLRKNNSSLDANAAFKKLRSSNDAAVYAFEREKNGNKIMVILNLSSASQIVTVQNSFEGKIAKDVFTGRSVKILKGFNLKPWDYKVYRIAGGK
jgi:alpha-amylase